MDRPSFDLEMMQRLMKMLSVQFGIHSEFILHDLTNGLESTVVAIENNTLTGRKVGDCSSSLGLELFRFEGKSETEDSYGYNVFFEDGRVYRSSTMYFKDEKGKINGAFCINTDITPLLSAGQYYKSILPGKDGDDKQVDEFFPHNINELMDTLIENCHKRIGKEAKDMTKEDKIEAVRYLDSKGAFLVSKSGVRVCKYLNISKGTLYSYLDSVREEEPHGTV